MKRGAALFIDKLILHFQFKAYQKTHTREEFEVSLIRLGCTCTHTRDETIFTTPIKKDGSRGKIILTGDELFINPK